MSSKNTHISIVDLAKNSDIDTKKVFNKTKMDFWDPVSLTHRERTQYLGQVLGLSKSLTVEAMHMLMEDVLDKQNTVSLSQVKPNSKVSKKDKKQDIYILNKIKPILGKMDDLGLDYLRIHIRDSIYNLGQDLKEKMLSKRYELRLNQKFQSFKDYLANNFKTINLEIQEILEKKELHLYLSKQHHNGELQNCKQIIINTKNKMITMLHLDELECRTEDIMESVHETSFMQFIYQLAQELELKPSVIRATQV